MRLPASRAVAFTLSSHRLYNDLLVENIAKATGSDLVRVSRGGDPHCEGCFPWAGRILSVSGQTEGFPTYDEAKAAGCFHPNCTHTLEYVDETADADEIALQREFPVEQGADSEAMYNNRREIDITRKMRNEGLSREAATVAVDRDNLIASMRTGLIRGDAGEVVAKMSDAQVSALCKGGRPPEFSPTKGTKKNPDPERWNHGSKGGVVHIARDATAERIAEVTHTTEADLLREKATAIAKAGASDGKTLTLAQIDAATAKEIKSVCGVAPKSLTPTVSGDEIRHTFNRHGKGRERNNRQTPITADDIARIPEIIAKRDHILQGTFNATENAPTVKFVKSYPDGTTYTVFAIANSMKYKTMWKKT